MGIPFLLLKEYTVGQGDGLQGKGLLLSLTPRVYPWRLHGGSREPKPFKLSSDLSTFEGNKPTISLHWNILSNGLASWFLVTVFRACVSGRTIKQLRLLSSCCIYRAAQFLSASWLTALRCCLLDCNLETALFTGLLNGQTLWLHTNTSHVHIRGYFSIYLWIHSNDYEFTPILPVLIPFSMVFSHFV